MYIFKNRPFQQIQISFAREPPEAGRRTQDSPGKSGVAPFLRLHPPKKYVKYIDTIKTKGGERNKEPLGGRNPVSWSISSSGALGSGRTWPSASQISSFLPTRQNI